MKNKDFTKKQKIYLNTIENRLLTQIFEYRKEVNQLFDLLDKKGE